LLIRATAAVGRNVRFENVRHSSALSGQVALFQQGISRFSSGKEIRIAPHQIIKGRHIA